MSKRTTITLADGTVFKRWETMWVADQTYTHNVGEMCKLIDALVEEVQRLWNVVEWYQGLGDRSVSDLRELPRVTITQETDEVK